MMGRIALLDTDFGCLVLPTYMMVDLRKPKVAKFPREGPNVELDVLPTQQRLIEKAEPQ